VILTFRQFVDEQRRHTAKEYGHPLAEIVRLYPDHFYTGEWWRYVIDAFNEGEDFSTQALATLTPGQHRELARTTRALRHGLDRRYPLAGARALAAAEKKITLCSDVRSGSEADH
jgi:hypothetical protein